MKAEDLMRPSVPNKKTIKQQQVTLLSKPIEHFRPLSIGIAPYTLQKMICEDVVERIIENVFMIVESADEFEETKRQSE